MTAHELARKLLAGPDLPVFYCDGSWGPQAIRQEKLHRDPFGDWHHVHFDGDEPAPILALELE